MQYINTELFKKKIHESFITELEETELGSIVSLEEVSQGENEWISICEIVGNNFQSRQKQNHCS